MRKTLFVCLFLLVPMGALAQATQEMVNSPGGVQVAGDGNKIAKNTPPKVEKKETPARPIIIDKAKQERLRLLQAEQKVAQLEAEAAVPQALKDAIKNANEAINKFWAEVGVTGDGKYTRSEGANGDIILLKQVEETPQKKEAPVVTPSPPKQ